MKGEKKKMNEVIYKYEASFRNAIYPHFELKMHKGAEILTAQKQDKMVRMWAKVNSDAPLEYRHFCWFKTGKTNQFNLKKEYKYISTIQYDDFNQEKETYHIFEEIEKLFE